MYVVEPCEKPVALNLSYVQSLFSGQRFLVQGLYINENSHFFFFFFFVFLFKNNDL